MSGDYAVAIPYKIHKWVENSGRHVAITKRHYHCRFGFAHLPSVYSGQLGVNCRGIEMDIHVIWSIASGKRTVHFNNVLLYEDIAVNRAVQRFDNTFSIPVNLLAGGHIIHITALNFASNPSDQFQVTLDGQNYDQFLAIFELGGHKMQRIYGGALKSYADHCVPCTTVVRGSLDNTSEDQRQSQENVQPLVSTATNGIDLIDLGNESPFDDKNNTVSTWSTMVTSERTSNGSNRSLSNDSVKGWNALHEFYSTVPSDTVTSNNHGASQCRPINGQQSSMSFLLNPSPYSAPPPPTWETLQTDFAYYSPPVHHPQSSSQNRFRS